MSLYNHKLAVCHKTDLLVFGIANDDTVQLGNVPDCRRQSSFHHVKQYSMLALCKFLTHVNEPEGVQYVFHVYTTNTFYSSIITIMRIGKLMMKVYISLS